MRHGADISVTRTYDNYIAALNLSRGIAAIILAIFIDNFDHDKDKIITKEDMKPILLSKLLKLSK